MNSERPERVQYQAPFALSMLICDAVHVDPTSGKITIIGCFGAISASRFPAVHPSMTIFAELTDGRGKVPLLLRVIDVDEDRTPVVEAQFEVDIPDPLAVQVVVWPLQGLTFPEPGEYRVQLFSGSEHLLERRLLLHSPPQARSTDDEPSDN
jgi:hypothetical protein